MNRTDAQQLVRDAAWRMGIAEKLARLDAVDLQALGLAIHDLLGWGVTGGRGYRDRRAFTIRRLIAKMDGEPTP